MALRQNQLEVRVDYLAELTVLTTSFEDFCDRVRRGLDHPTFDQKRPLVELLIDQVIITDNAVEIRYAFPTSKRSEHVVCYLRLDYRMNFCLVEYLAALEHGLRITA